MSLEQLRFHCTNQAPHWPASPAHPTDRNPASQDTIGYPGPQCLVSVSTVWPPTVPPTLTPNFHQDDSARPQQSRLPKWGTGGVKGVSWSLRGEMPFSSWLRDDSIRVIISSSRKRREVDAQSNTEARPGAKNANLHRACKQAVTSPAELTY